MPVPALYGPEKITAERKTMCCSFHFHGKSIRPTDRATVILPGKSSAQLQFGLRLDSGRLVINARCETALEKPLFRNLLLRSRVIIPADSFDEWDRRKVKYAFARRDGSPLLFAGIRSGASFVLLTTAANASMAPVHDRMPLVLEEAEGWLDDGDAFLSLLGTRPAELARAAAAPRQGWLL